MTSRKNKPKVIVKRSPLMQGKEGLSFDNVTSEELIELTDEQKADLWMSKWILNVHPFSRYPKFFKNNVGSYNISLSLIKKYYTRFVIKENWTELKYTFVINDILETRGVVFDKRIQEGGKRFDNGRLAAQLRMEVSS